MIKIELRAFETTIRKPIKNGKLLISHRYNRLSLLHSCPGEVQQELAV